MAAAILSPAQPSLDRGDAGRRDSRGSNGSVRGCRASTWSGQNRFDVNGLIDSKNRAENPRVTRQLPAAQTKTAYIAVGR